MNRFTLPVSTFCLMSLPVCSNAQDQTDTESDDSAKQIQMKMEIQPNACRAHLGVEYYQRGEHAHVTTELTNDDCAASSGRYTIRVRFRGEDGEIRNLDYPETWERADASPVESVKDYFVGENVDVIRVRVRDLKCECTAEEIENL
jgi:hypothetical protein